MASATATSLEAIRDSLLAIVAAQTAAWEAAGCPPTIGIDGESYDWNSWLQTKLDAIEKVTLLLAKLNPYYKRSRLRG